MTSELSFMISGIVFGLSGGLTPGPLFTLVVSETLKHGVKEGIKVSVVPLFSDLPSRQKHLWNFRVFLREKA